MGKPIAIINAAVVKTVFDENTFAVLLKNKNSEGMFTTFSLVGFNVVCTEKTPERIRAAVNQIENTDARYNIVGHWSRFDDRGFVQVLSLDDCDFIQMK